MRFATPGCFPKRLERYGRVVTETRAGLLERGRELDEIAAAVAGAAAGRGAVVLIEGEAGIGKTSLLNDAVDRGAAAGLTPLNARGSQLERDFAFGVVRQLIQKPVAELAEDKRREALSGAAALAGSLLTDGTADQTNRNPDMFSLLHGLHWLCANLAVTQPLLLAVDDVQWSDENSLRFLVYLGGRIEDLPVLVVATLRTGEPDSPDELLRELRLQPASTSIRPENLTLDATVSIVRGRISDDAEPAFCAACHESTAGNPLLLAELVRALELERVAPVKEGASRVLEIGAKGVPDRLLARITQLSPEALEVARAVATLEPQATMRRTASLASLNGDAAAAAAHALVEAGVFADTDPLGFVHPLLRSAVEGAMTVPQRDRLAVRGAEVHREDGSPPQVVASHLLKTHGEPPDWAVEALTSAADEAMSRGAPEAAVTYLRRAVELATGPETSRVRWALGSALLRATDAEGVEILLAERAASDDVVARAEAAHELAVSLVIRFRWGEAIQILQESIAELSADHAELSLILRHDLIQTLVNGGGDGKRLDEYFQELRSVARNLSGATLGERLALQGIAIAAAMGMDSAAVALRWAMTALGDANYMREAAQVGFPLSWACAAAAMAGNPTGALASYEVTVDEMRKRGSTFGVAQGLGTVAMVHLSRGDLADAESDLTEIAGLTGLPPMMQGAVLAFQAKIARERGQSGDALRAIAEAGLGGELPQMIVLQTLKTERALARLDQGQPEAALEDLVSVASAHGAVGGFSADLLPARLSIAAAIQATGDETKAIAEAHRADAWAGKTENPRFIAHTRRILGLLDQQAGIEVLRESVDLLAPTDYKLDLAKAKVDLGAALRRAKERKASRDPLREGMELAHRCGATALVERARTELEATGARPRNVFVSGVDSLTPSERRVAQLAAEGMTNREVAQTLYVTAKTVETHLRHCYQKLEISGRAELPGALAAPPDP